MTGDIDSLKALVERLRAIDHDQDPVPLRLLLQQLERRSFGALLFLAGLVVLAPLLGDIPGVPTTAAVLSAITSTQMLIGRRWFWLPEFLLRRSIARHRLESTLDFAYGPARFTDRFLRQQLERFTSDLANRIVAGAALGIALVMPALELIPFSANLAGAALAAFGISLIARDGLFALISLMLTGGLFALVGIWLAGF